MNTDTEFMDELEAATRMRASLASTIMLLAIFGLVVFFLFWASFSEIDELTRGSGQVVPSREIQVVQSLEGGILADLMVNEGDRVEKGQVLMRISDVQFASEESGIEARYAGLQAKKARLEAEAQSVDFVLPKNLSETVSDVAANELNLYRSRQQELANALAILEDKREMVLSDQAESRAQIKRLQDSSALLNEELVITSAMVAKRAVPKLEEIRLRRELSDVRGQLKAQEERLVGLASELNAIDKQLRDQHDKFRSQALGELAEVEVEISQLQASLQSIGDRVYRTELRSPVDGVVNNVALKTIGGVVEPAQRLVEIVPLDDELKIMARVLPADIAFLEPGQPVKVKITAYDPQRYGSIDGRLVRIGANSVNDRDGNIFFEIEVRTDKNYLGTEIYPLPITPGMVAETEIITGRRTIMEYLLTPVLRLKNRAFRER